MRGAAAALAAAILGASPAGAFDCAGVSGAAETAICSDPAAKRSDDAMNEAFARSKAKLGPAEDVPPVLEGEPDMPEFAPPDAELAGAEFADTVDPEETEL